MVRFVDVLEEFKRPFGESLLQGEFIKSVIRRVLEESHYYTFPYGYESFLTFIKRVIQEEEKPRSSPISRRIASTPDLVVYAHDKHKVIMAEVKSKNWNPADRLSDWDKLRIENYKTYWPECTLVVVVPSKHWFYAEDVDRIVLPDSKKENLDLTKKFKLFEEVFDKVSTDKLYAYKRIVAEVFGIFGTSRKADSFSQRTAVTIWITMKSC